MNDDITGPAEEGQEAPPEATADAQASSSFGRPITPFTPTRAPQGTPEASQEESEPEPETSETAKLAAARAGQRYSLRSDPDYQVVAPGLDMPAVDYDVIDNWRGLPLLGCQWTIQGSGARCPYSTTEEGDMQSHVKQTHYVRRPPTVTSLIYGPNGSPIDPAQGRAPE